MVKSKKFTDKQDAFCSEYIIDLNGTQAAIRAKYSEKTANRIASELLSKPDIQERIQELKSSREQRVKVDADWVLQQMKDIHELDVADILDNQGNFLQIKQWPKTWRMYISGLDIQELNLGDTEAVVKKIKWPDKVKNLEMIGRHVSVKAWDKEEAKDSGDLSEAVNKLIDRLPN